MLYIDKAGEWTPLPLLKADFGEGFRFDMTHFGFWYQRKKWTSDGDHVSIKAYLDLNVANTDVNPTMENPTVFRHAILYYLIYKGHVLSDTANLNEEEEDSNDSLCRFLEEYTPFTEDDNPDLSVSSDLTHLEQFLAGTDLNAGEDDDNYVPGYCK